MKKMNKLVALLLAVVMVLGMMPTMTVRAHAHTHAAELQGIEEYPSIPLGETVRVDIPEPGIRAYFTFTPEVTDLYHFYSLTPSDSYSADTYGHIYDVEMNELAYNDDAYDSVVDGVSRPNFCVSAVLEAGVTYILCGRLYSAFNTGSFDVALTQGHEYESTVTKEETCDEDGILTWTCKNCGDSYEEAIPAAHTYSDETGECIHCGAAYLLTGTCGESVTWSLDWFGTLTISGTGAMDDYSVSWTSTNPSPWYNDHNNDIKTVVVEEGVTSVGSYAFYQCKSLESVTLADSVVTLGTAAFNNCNLLTSISLPDGITAIPDYCFNYCRLTEIDWPAGLTTIGSNAFSGCYFGDLVLPEGLTTLGQNAFSSCSNMKRLTMPTTLTTISAYAFSSMYNTKEFIFTGDAPSFGTYCFNYLTVTVWYPAGNETWTNAINQNYGGSSLTWKAMCAGDHTWGEAVTTAPTCEHGSFTTLSCTACGFSNTSPEADDALGHDFQYAHYEGACGESSYDTVTCSRCDYYATENRVWKDHEYEITTVAATCTEGGYDLYTCTICGDSYDWNWTSALGHNVENWSEPTEATCTEPGVKTGSCARCGETATEQITAALGHTWDEENGVANADGSITYSCIRCDATYTTEGSSLHLGDNTFSIAAETGRATKSFTAEQSGTLSISLNQMTYHNNWAWDNGYSDIYWSPLAIDYVFQEGWFNVYVNNKNTAYRIDGYESAATIILNTTEVKAGDVVTIEVNHLESSDYFNNDVQFNLNLALEVTEPEQPEPSNDTLVLGDNEIDLVSGLESEVLTWTAQESGTLTVELSKLTFNYYGFWMDEPAASHLSDRAISFKINGESVYTVSNTVAVSAGDVVTVQVGNYTGMEIKAVITLSLESGSTEPEELTLVLGDNTIDLPASSTGEGPTATWTAEEDGSLVVTLVSLAYHSDVMTSLFGEYWTDVPVYTGIEYNYYTFEVNGERITDTSGVATVEVNAGDVVTVKVGNCYTYVSQAVVNLAISDSHTHSYEAVVTAPTCTEGGYTTYTCECGDTYVADETAALGHTEETVPGTEATFDADGLTEGKICSVCGETLVAQETIAKLDYNEGTVPVAVMNATAGDYYGSDLPANALDGDFATMWHTNWYGSNREGHWIQFELTDTYAVDGLRYKPRTDLNRQGEPQLNGTITEYQILVSNDAETWTEVADGNWEANQNWKTVSFDAQTVKYIRLVSINACSDNDSVFASAAEIRLTGVKDETPHQHTAAEAVLENVTATCTAAGTADSVVYCAECGEEISRETVEVAKLGHEYEVVEVVPPTCTKSGYTVYGCVRCDKTYKDDPIEPEHKWDEGTVTAPTCTELGYTTYTCQVCGFEYVDEASLVPALGHAWKGVECERCDATRENPFTDVPNDSFCIDAVLWAVEEGITEGTSDTTFNPGGACQRAIVVTFLWRAAGSPEPTTTENPFTDVKENAFYYKAVLWAVEKGITTGTSETTFDPGALCNRATVVTFLYRALGEPEVNTTENPFTDVKADSWYGPAVLWAVENGVTEGVGNGLFAPGTNCNRAQVVTFLHRAMA